MQLKHVTDRAPHFGSIDDVFRNSVAAGHDHLQGIVDLLPVLRKAIHGPPAWACESHGRLFIMPYDRPDGDDPNRYRFAQIQVLGYTSGPFTDYTIYFDIPSEDAEFPFQNRLVLEPQNHIQAAVAVARGLRSIFQIFDGSLATHRFVNENSVMQMRRISDSVHRCPHCKLDFKLTDSNAWDGQRHLVCHQLLEPSAQAS